MNKNYSNKIKLIEQLTGFRVLLVEVDEGLKNNAISYLQRISDDLDNLSNDITIAISKIGDLPNQDAAKTKLTGLASIVASAQSDNAEMISNITNMQSNQAIMDQSNQLPPSEGDINEDLSMTSDDVINNLDKVKKMEDKNIPIRIDDDTTSTAYKSNY